MRALILGNGDVFDYPQILRRAGVFDLLICADGGLRHAEAMGLTPDILLGDMDSARDIPADVARKVFPARKDETDGEIAVDYALAQGADEIVLAGFSGCRLDHTLTNIYFLKQIADAGKSGVFIDDKNEIYFIRERLVLQGTPGEIVSVVPLCQMEGVSTKGLEYTLREETLYFGRSRGVSNVLTQDTCEITVRSGYGLVLKSRD